jgi:hypothetical protein
MLRKLLSAVGLIDSTSPAVSGPSYVPYKVEASNAIYNLLFCDSPAAFMAKPNQSPTDWQLALASSPPNLSALNAIAADSAQEGRVRYMAYQRLRTAGQAVPAKHLLGVIVEVPLDGGLDTLAAFAEGGVRYINQTGKLAVVEGVSSFRTLVDQLFLAAQPLVAKIGPWTEPRRAPPEQGGVRLTFLVSDGLYFGEGPFATLQRDQMAGPIIQRATDLLRAVASMNSK